VARLCHYRLILGRCIASLNEASAVEDLECPREAMSASAGLDNATCCALQLRGANRYAVHRTDKIDAQMVY
jgi:hypothetical protein